MAKAFSLKLNNGHDIPVLGLGTYALNLELSEEATVPLGTLRADQQDSNREGNRNKACLHAVEVALECGYRHIDTAAFYENEKEIGQAIQNCIKKGIITRKEIFITTKLWNDRHDYDKVVPSLQESLKKLSLDYVDLYLIHWPIGVNENGEFGDVDYLETWQGMEKCVELGLTKSIGISNFNIEQMERLLKNCQIAPTVNQFEINPNLTRKDWIKYCKSKNIVVTSYCPFGSMPESKSKVNSPAPHLNDPILTEMGKKYNKTTSQIVLRYLIDCGTVVIPKSVTPERIKQNIEIFDFSLAPEEVAKIDEFNINYQLIAVPFWKGHKYYPF